MPDTQTTIDAFSLPWIAIEDYGDNRIWCVVCPMSYDEREAFLLMAKDLTKSVATHIVKLHNASMS